MRERMYEIYDEEKFIGKLSADEAAKLLVLRSNAFTLRHLEVIN